MYKNIGKKISGWARFLCIMGIILSVLVGVLFIAGGSIAGAASAVMLGVLVIVIGVLVSWISSLALYGFGELITKTDESNASLKKLVGE